MSTLFLSQPLTHLEVIAAGLAATAPEVPLVRFDDHRHARCVVSAGAYDAWVIRWEPAANLELHDHGGACGVVHVVEGDLYERYTDIASHEPLLTRVVSAGEAISITPTTVHAVANLGTASALSVHVYSPPLSTMSFYDERDGALRRTRVERGDTSLALVP